MGVDEHVKAISASIEMRNQPITIARVTPAIDESGKRFRVGAARGLGGCAPLGHVRSWGFLCNVAIFIATPPALWASSG